MAAKRWFREKTSFCACRSKILQSFLFLVLWSSVCFFTAEVFFTGSSLAAEALVPKVQLEKARADYKKITVTWKAVRGASKYIIYRKGGGTNKYKRIAVQKASAGRVYTDKDVKKGIVYTYTVKACKKISGNMRSGKADLAGVSAAVIIPAVQLESFVVNGESIVVRWKKQTEISGYRVFRKTDKGTFQVLADVMNPSSTSYTDASAGMGHLYTYTVCALVKDGNFLNQGEWEKNGVSARRKLAAPELFVKAASGKVFLTWTSEGGAEGFRIYRRLSGSTAADWEVLGNVRSTARTFWDTSAVPGKTYIYTIRSFVRIRKKKVFSDCAGEMSVVCMPSAAIITCFTEESHTAVLVWNTVVGADGYMIYRRENGKWKKEGEVSSDKNTYTVHHCADGTQLAVRAVVKSGNKYLKSQMYFPVTAGGLRYTQQRILFIGDSLTWGYSWGKNRTTVPFPARVALLTGATAVNRGITGITMGQSASKTSSVIRRLELRKDKYSNYTAIVLAIGTNDYGKNVPLGTASDQTTDTFYGALNQWFRFVRETNPDARILVVLPSYRSTLGYDLYVDPWRTKNECGATLTQYSKALKQTALRNGAAVLDPQAAGVLAEEDQSFLVDGLHFSEDGYQALGDAVTEALKKLLPVDSVD